MADTYDLMVIGGGPAGSAAAITARNAGARVLLLERARLPRHKVCGEFVSAESLALLSSLLDAKHGRLLTDAVRIDRARLFVDGRIIETPVEPAAASITRLDLDIALWESAVRAGVDAPQQVTVSEIVGHGPFRLTTSAGEFDGRAVVNAAGRWSNLSTAATLTEKQQVKWVGLKGHFAEDDAAPSVDLYFFEGGYCGVQPLGGGRVNACAMVRADAASKLTEVFALHPALAARSVAWRGMSEPVSVSPLIFRKPQPVRDGVMMAGDAAAFVDPFVGDGISLALRSGAWAGQCLLPFFREEVPLAQAVGQYARTYEQRFTSVFRTSSRIRRALRLPRPVRGPLLVVLQKTPKITKYLVSKTR
jgi:flavin-dependent dehydrogenase